MKSLTIRKSPFRGVRFSGFILVEPTKRSEEIQTILKLDELGQTRSALNTAPEQASWLRIGPLPRRYSPP